MEQKFLIAVIIAVVCAGLAGFFGYSESVATREKQRLESQVSTLNQENMQIKSQLEQLKTAQAALERDYDALKAEREALQAKRATSGAKR